MHILHIETDDDETIANIKINVDCLKRNSNTSDESGLVEVPCQDDMPCWVLSAMKCLSDWPDNIDTGLPNYEGILFSFRNYFIIFALQLSKVYFALARSFVS